MQKEAQSQAEKKAKALGKRGPYLPLTLLDLTQAPAEVVPLLPSPGSGQEGDLTPPRDFNLMFSTSVGAVAGEAGKSYLRPETAQGIFVNYLNIQRSSRMKVSTADCSVDSCANYIVSSSGSLWHRSDWKGLPQRDHPP